MRPYLLPTLAPHAIKHRAIAILSAVIMSAIRFPGEGTAGRRLFVAAPVLHFTVLLVPTCQRTMPSDYRTISPFHDCINRQIVNCQIVK